MYVPGIARQKGHWASACGWVEHSGALCRARSPASDSLCVCMRTKFVTNIYLYFVTHICILWRSLSCTRCSISLTVCVYVYTQFVTNMYLFSWLTVYVYVYTVRDEYVLIVRDSYLHCCIRYICVYTYTICYEYALIFRDSYLQRCIRCICVCIHSSWLICTYVSWLISAYSGALRRSRAPARDSLYTCMYTQFVTKVYVFSWLAVYVCVHTVCD